MKFVGELRNKYEGKEIWILGEGPSLDDYPDDFFDNKISIAANFAIVAFPNCTYWSVGHPEAVEIIMRWRPRIFKRTLCLLPFVPRISKTNFTPMSEKESLKILGKYRNDPFFFRWNRVGGGKLGRFLFYHKETVGKIMAGETCRFTCFGTIVHYAIEIAVLMGSKQITLAGCDEAGRKDGKWHAQGRGILKFSLKVKDQGITFRSRPPRTKRVTFARYRTGTRLLAKAFGEYGVKVRKYYPGSGYQEIP